MSENLSDVEMDDLGNVFARLPGEGHPAAQSWFQPTVILFFPRETDLTDQTRTWQDLWPWNWR